MSMAGFTAESSVYQPTGHYRTSGSHGDMIGLSLPLNSRIYPAMENIQVEGCGPGQWDLRDGDGNLMGCVDVGGGGGGGVGTGGGDGPGSGGGGGGGGGSGTPPSKYHPRQGNPCH